ncbi:MAG: DNA polymerase III subunit alpha [Metamycoplasmataceae bacterium]
MKKSNKFINLHLNTEFSILESSILIDEYLNYQLNNEFEYAVITEHNNFFSLAEFKQKCESLGLKPIFGIDLDINDSNKNYRIIVIAKSYVGFQKLIKISSCSTNNNINLDELNINDLLLIDHPKYGFFSNYKKQIPKDFVFYNSEEINDKRSILIKEQICLNESGKEVIKALNEIKNGEKIKKEIDVFSPYSENDEMIQKTNDIAKSCYFEFPDDFGKYNFPSFINNENLSSFEYLKKIINENIPNYQKHFKDKEKAISRIKFELEVIKKLNFSDYFLIIFDIINFANKSNIAIGPGRGSAASSIICFILGITRINPLEFGLVFERFLNLSRISMPDIDIDIQDDRREEIFEYIRQKYGNDHVCLITTFQKLSAKSALKDIAKIQNIKFNEINEITKLISTDQDLETAYKSDAKFRAKIKSKVEFDSILNLAIKIQSFPRQTGIHAAGVIISKEKLNNVIPVYSENGNFVSQLSMDYLEKWGLLKIDLLGLKTLTIIKNIIELIKKENPLFNINNINYSDESTFNLLNNGDTIGIFQMESQGMINTLKRVKVNKFLDIVDIISLFRPGPMQNIQQYIDVKNGIQKIEHISDAYDQIVKETNGIIIYQEQIMEIAKTIAIMSYSEADILRKAISKKNLKEITDLKLKFVNGSKSNGYSEDIANSVFNQIEKFAQYGFNKAHAVSYATLTYQMAFLKAKFPVFFYCSILNPLPGLETINNYVIEMKKYKYEVFSPLINKSNINVYNEGNNIILTFQLIKGIGQIASQKIIDERTKNGNFTSFFNFIARAKKNGIGDSIIEKLILSNSLREFGNMKTLISNLEAANYYYENISVKSKTDKTIVLNFNAEEELSLIEKEIDYIFEAKNEIEQLGGIYNAFPTLKFESDDKLVNIKEGIEYILCLMINKISEKKDKNQNEIGIIEVMDSSKKETFFLFKEVWEKYKTVLKENQIIKIKVIKYFNSFKNQYGYKIRDIMVKDEK